MATTEAQAETGNHPSVIVDMRSDMLIRVALLGLGVGAAIWVLTWVLASFVIGPVICGSDNACVNSSTIAGNVALVITSVAGMLGLVRMGVYRPMLIAIAVTATLWNIGSWISGIVWYEALGWSALIVMLTYLAYAWIVRLRNFITVLVILVVIIIALRYISLL